MSRSGYEYDEIDQWAMIKWRGMVTSATRGKRGQAMLRDLLAALDAMPEKRLIAEELEHGGEVCAMGALGKARGVDMSQIDPEDYEHVARTFNVANCLAQEIAYENDEGHYQETPEHRWQRMRAWVASLIKNE
jgi:hypothetical protein